MKATRLAQRKLNASHGPVNTLSSSKRPVAKPSGEHSLMSGFSQSTAVYPPYTDDLRSPFFGLDPEQPGGNRSHGILRGTRSVQKSSDSGPKIGVPEFRYAQPETLSSKSRFRRSRHADGSARTRGSRRDSNSSSVSKDLGTAPSPNRTRDVTVESPDILAEENPITSPVVHDAGELQHSKKRMQSAHGRNLQEPCSKRIKHIKDPIDDREDELCNDPQQSSDASTRIASRQRGESIETKRQLVLESLNANPDRWSRQSLTVKRAVSGKQLYEVNDMPQHQVALLPASNGRARLVPKTTTNEIAAQSWLGIDLFKVLRVQHARGCSFAIFERPSSSGVPPKLFLEFKSHEGPQTLVNFFGDTELACCSPQMERLQPQTLEAKFNKAVMEARKYNAGQPKMNNGPIVSSIEYDQGHDTDRLSTLRSATQGGEIHRRRSEGLTDRVLEMPTESFSGSSNAPNQRSSKNVYSTRRTRRSSPFSPHFARYDRRWTEKHPDWRASWKKSLIYPATGKDRTTVDEDDIPRLDEGEFLNDNLISFYLRFLQLKIGKERPQLSKRVYIFSTFFFEKLRSTRGKINYDGVKAWTAKVDLFAYDYIVVPVNERAHWYLAVICNAGNALIAPACEEDETKASNHIPQRSVPGSPNLSPSTVKDAVKDAPPAEPLRTNSSSPKDREADSKQPKIIILDSLQTAHPSTCKALKEYLVEEARSRKCLELAMLPQGMSAKQIPYQDNFCDCGVFVLGYVKEFLKDPDEVTRKLLQREALAWDISPSCIRNQIRDLLFDLQKQQIQGEQTDEQEQNTPRQDAKSQASTLEPIVGSGPLVARQVVGTDEALDPAHGESEKAKVPRPVPNCPHQRNEDERGHLGQSMKCLSIHDINPPLSPTSNERVDVFYSAPSTPEDVFMSPEKAGLKAKADTKSLLSHSSEPRLIDLLPSSSSAGEETRPDRVTDATSRTASVVDPNENTMQMQWSPTGDKLVAKLSSSPTPTVRQGPASDDLGMKHLEKAGYDGIDRTLDLT